MSRVDAIFDLLIDSNPEAGDAVVYDLPTFDEILELAETAEPPTTLPTRWETRSRGPIVGLAVAVAIVVVGLGAALVAALFTSESAPPGTEMRPTEPTAPAEPSLEPESEAGPSFPPSGPGEQLAWTKARVGESFRADHAVWFAGEFYALDGSSGIVFHSSNGLTWEADASIADALRPGAAAIDGLEDAEGVVLASGPRRLMAVALVEEHRPNAAGCASVVRASLHVAVKTNGTEWAVSKVPISLPSVGRAVCVEVDLGPAAIGPPGIFVSAAIRAEDDLMIEAVAASVLGDAIYEEGFALEVIGDEIVVTMRDNEQRRVPLADVGLDASAFAIDDPVATTAVAWTSADGTEWQEVRREGAMRSFRLDGVAAGMQSFYVSSPSGTFRTLDGVAWERLDAISLGDGLLRAGNLLAAWDDTVMGIADDATVLYDLPWQTEYAFSEIVGDALPDDLTWAFGPAGALAHTLDPWGWNPDEARMLWYTPDNNEWRLWAPIALTDSASMGVVESVVGEDRVVLFGLEYAGEGNAPEPVIWVGVPDDAP